MSFLELSKRDLSRIHYVDTLVYKFYKTSLYSFCKKYQYDPVFIEIIRQVTELYYYDTLGYFKIEIDDTLNKRCDLIREKFSYGSDNRKIEERIVSLGVNWIVEDVIVHKSSSVFILTGCDSSRDYLTNPITSTPDIRYVGKGESFYVEVCSDFTEFMKRFRRYDIRKLKYCKLEDLLCIDRKKTLLLFVDVVNKTYYTMWFKSVGYNMHNKYGTNTVTYEFDEEVEFKGFEHLFEYLKSCQSDTSLYSNFNVNEEKKVVSNDCYEDYTQDEGYWKSLFDSIPAYIPKLPQYYEDLMNEEENNNVNKEEKISEENSVIEGFVPLDNPFFDDDLPF